MKLQAIENHNTWTITTPDGETIEDVRSVAEGYLPGIGLYLSVYLHIPIQEEPLLDPHSVNMIVQGNLS